MLRRLLRRLLRRFARRIIGKYYKKEGDPSPTLTRNDYMISFHLLNYGPGQSEPDPSVFPESAFSSVHEGFLTPDCTVEGATFQLYSRGINQKYRLTIDGRVILQSGKCCPDYSVTAEF